MISTKGRYALRVMLDLAQQDPNCFTPLDEIASRQGISKKYLEIILKVLVQEKLLKGLRGKGGGCAGNCGSGFSGSALPCPCGNNMIRWCMISSIILPWKIC